MLPNVARKLLIAVSFTLFLFCSSLAPVYAQYQNYSPIATNFDTNVAPTMHNWFQAAFIDALSGVDCLLAGYDPLSPNHQCLGVNAVTGKIGFVKDTNHGAIGVVASGLDEMFIHIPIHTKDYVAYMGSNFGFTKAYADQGSGFLGITPLLSTWVVMRNIAYLIAIIVFAGIGLALMLRVKIDPRTVMTIQNSIPKIIVGIILITFSYAISGLLIDAMYIVFYVIVNIYMSVPGITHSLTAQVLQDNTPLGVLNNMDPGNVFGLGGGLMGISSNIGGAMGSTVQQIIGISGYASDIGGGVARLIGWVLGTGLGIVEVPAGQFLAWMTVLWDIAPVPGNLHTPNFVDALVDLASVILSQKAVDSITSDGGIGQLILEALHITPESTFPTVYQIVEGGLRAAAAPLIISVIIFLALLLSMIKLFFSLLQAWLTILFYIVLSPILILFGIVPKVKTGFGSWFKSLAANLLAFPITAGILLFGQIIIQTFSNPQYAGKYFIPPLLGGGSLPIGPIIAVATFFIAANGPAIAKGLLDVKDDKNTGGAFSQGVGGGLKTLTNTGKGIAESTAQLPGGTGGQQVGWRAFLRL